MAPHSGGLLALGFSPQLFPNSFLPPLSLLHPCRPSLRLVLKISFLENLERPRFWYSCSCRLTDPFAHNKTWVGLKLDFGVDFMRVSGWTASGKLKKWRRRIGDWTTEQELELELQILRFMESSANPNSFPTKKELLDAGKGDLVASILRHGGWMTAGWDIEQDISDGIARRKDIEQLHVNGRTSETLSGPLSGASQETRGDFQKIDASEMMARNASVSQSTMLQKVRLDPNFDRRKNWQAVANMLGIASSNKKKMSQVEREQVFNTKSPWSGPESDKIMDPERTYSEAQKFSRKSVHFGHQERGEHGKSMDISENASTIHAEEVDACEKLNDVLLTLEWLHQNVERRKQWIMKAKSRPPANPSFALFSGSTFASRIASLESRLNATRAALQSGRALLEQSSNHVMQSTEDARTEIAEASDALEFNEDVIMRTRLELRKTRAQVTALEGTLATELMEMRKVTNEKEKQLKKMEEAMIITRTVRIVWPHPASEVLLTGSFDGWTSKIKMTKSSAGVFVSSLQLYPGRYEIKFIADGSWSVDPCRPITCTDGMENNILWVV